jgi:release factor glutamine methyltransferase
MPSNMPPLSVAEIRQRYLKKVDPFEIDLFIMHATQKSREFLWAHPEYTLSSLEVTRVNRYINRRLKHEPVAYILGHKEFFGLDFRVTKDTLIPRPETEGVVEAILQHLAQTTKNESPQKVASLSTQKTCVIDVGTGSGNILISLAKHLQNASSKFSHYRFFGLDISLQALRIARSNAKYHSVKNHLHFKHSNLLTKLLPHLKQSKHYSRIILAANLPYLSKEIYETTSLDVKKHEPKSALYSPEKGLGHYRKLFHQIKNIQQSRPDLSFSIFLEISPEQKKLLSLLIKQHFPNAQKKFIKDLTSKWRIALIETKARPTL